MKTLQIVDQKNFRHRMEKGIIFDHKKRERVEKLRGIWYNPKRF